MKLRKPSRRNLLLAAALIFLAGCTPADAVKGCASKIKPGSWPGPTPVTTAPPPTAESCALIVHFPTSNGDTSRGIPIGWDVGLAEPAVGLHTFFDVQQWATKCRAIEPYKVLKITGATNDPSGPRVDAYLRQVWGSPYLLVVYPHKTFENVTEWNDAYIFIHKLDAGVPAG